MTRNLIEELTGALNLVGFKPDKSMTFDDEITARRWTSPYAHFYLAEVGKVIESWPSLMSEIDRNVLKALRADELKHGGVWDAHVCFLINDGENQQIQNYLTHDSSWNVSRKYWISHAEGFSGIQTRLSLLGINQPSELVAESSFGIDSDEQKWVDSLVSEGPEVIFQRFLNSIGAAR